MSALRDTGCALVRRAPAWQAGHPGPAARGTPVPAACRTAPMRGAAL